VIKIKTIEFDITKLSDALGIPVWSVRELFSDGRPVSFIIKQRLAVDMGWGLADKNDDYDWIDEFGNYVESRVLTRHGVSFVPNKMLGTGRYFEQEGFLTKLNIVEFFIVTDVTRFPFVHFYKIDSGQIRKWYHSGKILDGGKLTVGAFFRILQQPDLFDGEIE